MVAYYNVWMWWLPNELPILLPGKRVGRRSATVLPARKRKRGTSSNSGQRGADWEATVSNGRADTIPWALLDELDAAKYALQNEKRFVEFHLRIRTK